MEAAASYSPGPAPPTHIAIIMDGNGRWAKARFLPRIAGHQRGAEVVRETVAHCRELGVTYLTIYAFSSENWKRSSAEVDDLMGLLRIYLERELDALVRDGVKLRFIGNRHRLPDDIIELIEGSERRTSGNTGLTLTVALNYGGRDEIVQATRRIAEAAVAGSLDTGMIDQALFAANVIRDEDYAVGARSQVGADSGLQDHVIFGRNEPALHHYHNTYRAALGMEPLQPYEG